MRGQRADESSKLRDLVSGRGGARPYRIFKARHSSPCRTRLSPPRMAEELYLPYFAKATKGFSLSSALVTEEIYVQAGAETKAFAFANFDEPRGAGG